MNMDQPKRRNTHAPGGAGEPPPSGAARSPSSAPPPSGVTLTTGGHAPLARRSIRLGGFDEARSVLSDLYSGGSFEPQRGEAFEGTLDVITSGSIRVISGSWRAGWYGDAPEIHDRYILSLATAGAGRGTYGREGILVVPDRAGCLFSPGRSAYFEASPGLEGRTITVERGALEAHFLALTGRSLHGPIHFEPALDLQSGPGSIISGIAKVLRAEVVRPGSSALLIGALREALMTSMLSTLEHSASALFEGQPPRVAPRQVRRAEEYIEAHAAEPLTLADIARAAGVSARSLQVTFKEYRGISPMESLRRRRFDLARQQLMTAGPEARVASIVGGLALAGAGGRFSVDYRRRFGESPSETLARAHGGQTIGDRARHRVG